MIVIWEGPNLGFLDGDLLTRHLSEACQGALRQLNQRWMSGVSWMEELG